MRVRFHQGTADAIGRVSVARFGKPSAEGEVAPVEIGAGERGYARLRLERPAVLTRGDRFILRSYSPSVTIGGGVVLDPEPPRGGLRTESGWRRFVALDVDPPDEGRVVTALVEERGTAGLARVSLIRRLGLSNGDAEALIARLAAGGRVLTVEQWLVAPEAATRVASTLVDIIHAYHRRTSAGGRAAAGGGARAAVRACRAGVCSSTSWHG